VYNFTLAAELVDFSLEEAKIFHLAAFSVMLFFIQMEKLCFNSLFK